MPEGLDPIETGKKLHEHGEEHDQQAGGNDEHGGTSDRHSRIIQISEAVLLSIVTITAAWAGYSAARWGTASRVDIARSSTLRNFATRDDLTATSLRNFDSSTFNAWFTAYTLNSPQKEAIAIHRFRPEFRVAFNAWMATDPLHNPNAPPGPTYMPQYKLPAQAQAIALDNEANTKFDEGTKDGVTGDNFVQINLDVDEFAANFFPPIAALFFFRSQSGEHEADRNSPPTLRRAAFDRIWASKRRSIYWFNVPVLLGTNPPMAKVPDHEVHLEIVPGYTYLEATRSARL